MFVSFHSRSPQIAAAARLVAVNWAFSLQLWLIADGEALRVYFFFVDAFTAAAFFLMSKGRWFPVPLFFLHSALGAYHLFSTAFLEHMYWIQAILNRALEIEILYVGICAAYRIIAQRVPARY